MVVQRDAARTRLEIMVHDKDTISASLHAIVNLLAAVGEPSRAQRAALSMAAALDLVAPESPEGPDVTEGPEEAPEDMGEDMVQIPGGSTTEETVALAHTSVVDGFVPYGLVAT